jgi:hypothetical protein
MERFRPAFGCGITPALGVGVLSTPADGAWALGNCPLSGSAAIATFASKDAHNRTGLSKNEVNQNLLMFIIFSILTPNLIF